MWDDASNPPLIQPEQQATFNNSSPVTPPVIVNTKGSSKGKGKLIAALFGVLLLVGGVAAGLLLVNQQQLVNQKAATPPVTPPNLQTDNSNCGSVGFSCQTGTSCKLGVCTATSKAICGGTCTQDSDCARTSGGGFQPVCTAGKCVNPSCPTDTITGTICGCGSAVVISCGQPCGAQADGNILSSNCGTSGVCGNNNIGTTGQRCLPAPPPSGYVTGGGICANDPNPDVACINHTDGTSVTTVFDLQSACNGTAFTASVATTTPTATATSRPSPIPTATALALVATTTPTATQMPIPVTGFDTPTILGVGIGIILTLGGIILVL